MKNNIIYLNSAVGPSFRQTTRISIPTEKGFGLLDSAVALWLGAWTLVAAFAFFAA